MAPSGGRWSLRSSPPPASDPSGAGSSAARGTQPCTASIHAFQLFSPRFARCTGGSTTWTRQSTRGHGPLTVRPCRRRPAPDPPDACSWRQRRRSFMKCSGRLATSGARSRGTCLEGGSLPRSAVGLGLTMARVQDGQRDQEPLVLHHAPQHAPHRQGDDQANEGQPRACFRCRSERPRLPRGVRSVRDSHCRPLHACLLPPAGSSPAARRRSTSLGEHPHHPDPGRGHPPRRQRGAAVA